MNRLLFLMIIVVIGGMWGIRPLQAANATVGTGTSASCTESAFNGALSIVQSSGSGTITFNCGGPATILFSIEKYIYNSAVTIDGGNKITLSGSNSTRLFYVIAGSLTLKDITISNGFANDNGGAIYNNDQLTLENTTIRNSSVTNNFSGGAITSVGQLTIRNSLLEGNNAGSGGALFLYTATSSSIIENSVLQDNGAATASSWGGWGGAIFAWDQANVTLDGGEISGNSASKGGGGIYNTNSSTLGITGNTVIQNNRADYVSSGGGIYNDGGTMILDQAIIQGNSAQDGGGIYNSGGMTLVDVTLSDNEARGGYGGGIQNWSGNGTLERVTLNENSAYAGGGGLSHFDGLITIINSTISGNLSENSGGGIGKAEEFLGPLATQINRMSIPIIAASGHHIPNKVGV